MDIGERIKELREQKGMTLEELGNKVGVGKSTVRKWETGMIANMRRDKIAKVAQALDVSPAVIMGWEISETTNPERVDYLALNDDEKILIESYRSSDNDTKRMIQRLLAYSDALNKK